MSSNVHSQLTGTELHSPYFKVYASEGARLSDSTLTSTDLYKKCFVTSTNLEYTLKSISPSVVWVSTSGGGGGGGGSSIIYSSVSDADPIIGVPVAERLEATGAENIATGQSIRTIPAGTLEVGDRIIYRALATYVNPAVARNFIINTYFGSTFLPGNSFTPGNSYFYFAESQFNVVSIGTSLVLSGLNFGDIAYKNPPIGILPTGASGFAIATNVNTSNLDIKFSVEISGAASSSYSFDILFTEITVVRG